MCGSELYCDWKSFDSVLKRSFSKFFSRNFWCNRVSFLRDKYYLYNFKGLRWGDGRAQNIRVSIFHPSFPLFLPLPPLLSLSRGPSPWSQLGGLGSAEPGRRRFRGILRLWNTFQQCKKCDNRLVKIWQSCKEHKGGNVFETQCTSMLFYFLHSVKVYSRGPEDNYWGSTPPPMTPLHLTQITNLLFTTGDASENTSSNVRYTKSAREVDLGRSFCRSVTFVHCRVVGTCWCLSCDICTGTLWYTACKKRRRWRPNRCVDSSSDYTGNSPRS